MAHPSENVYLNSMSYFLYSSSCNPSQIENTLLESKLISQSSIEPDHLLKNVKNLGSNKKINFSSESIKKQTVVDLLFIIDIYSLQNVKKHHSNEKLVSKYTFCNNHSFCRFGVHFNGRPKTMNYRQFFQKIIFDTRPCYKKTKSSEAQSNCFIF